MTETKLSFKVVERQETLEPTPHARQCKITFLADCPDKSILPDGSEITLAFGTAGKATAELAKLQPGDRIVLLMKDEGLSSW